MKTLFVAIGCVPLVISSSLIYADEDNQAFLLADELAIPLVEGGGIIDKGNGRVDFGWGGQGGGNLEAYSKEASGNYAGRKGRFSFIFGGAPGMGDITFTHFDGSSWDNKVLIQPNGDVITKGAMKATQMVVDTEANIWPDYVFKDSYSLIPITEMRDFIEREGHLPGMPSAADIAENGHDLGLVSAKTLEKVEELALYVIQLKEENEGLRQELNTLKTAIAD